MKFINKTITLVVVTLISFSSYSLEDDKRKHFVFSYAIGVGTTTLMDDWKYALSSCVAVGLAKEVYDEISYGGFDEKDLLADFVGCSMGLVTIKGLEFAFDEDNVSVEYTYKF